MDGFKLSRAYLRPETKPGYEKAMWRPTWRCFCCQDSGLVKDYLVERVIDGYDPRTDKPVRCNALNCKAREKYGQKLIDTGTLDLRFPTSVCDRFDLQEREMWRQELLSRYQQRKIDIANATRNLRQRERTPAEHLDAQRKHQTMRRE